MWTVLWSYVLCMLLCCCANDLGLPQPTSLVQHQHHHHKNLVGTGGGGRNNKEIRFTVHQTVLGVNAKSFNNNYAVNSETYKQTVASCMAGVLPDDIYNLRAEPCSANGACSQQFAGISNGPDEMDSNSFTLSRDQPRKVNHPEERMILSYTVKLRTTVVPFKLYSQLLSASKGAVFDDNLQSFANENDATELYNVDTGVANVIDPKAPSVPVRHLRGGLHTNDSKEEDMLTAIAAQLWAGKWRSFSDSD